MEENLNSLRTQLIWCASVDLSFSTCTHLLTIYALQAAIHTNIFSATI